MAITALPIWDALSIRSPSVQAASKRVRPTSSSCDNPPRPGAERMKRSLFFAGACLAIAIGALAFTLGSRAAQTDPELRVPAAKEWLHAGGDWSNSRYSTLTQLNPATVKNLKGAWVTHLGSGLGAKYSL